MRDRAQRIFRALTARPRTALAACALPLLFLAGFIPTLEKDTSSEASMPPDHPAVVHRHLVEETFGLGDPVVLAVVSDRPEGVFHPDTLRLVWWLTDAIARVPGVDPDRVTSLATEKSITGTADALLSEPFLPAPPATRREAERVREAVAGSELHHGTLVAADGSATVVAAELLDERFVQGIYSKLEALVAEAPRNGEAIHIAGESATSSAVGLRIDHDTRRLNPLAGLVIVAVLWLSYRTVRGVVLPMLVVLGAIAATLGAMGAAGVPYYLVTSALTVILIGIGVCDGIHILGAYYAGLAQRPERAHRDTVVAAMVEMWRPVTVTSFTSMAGFLALSLATFMPPMRAFGGFAALGVLWAWLLSLVGIPCLLVLLRPVPSPAFRAGSGGAPAPDLFARAASRLGRAVTERPRSVLAVGALGIAAALLGASRLTLEDERVSAFREDDPVHEAILAIDRHLSGSSWFDVVVETDEPGGLLRPRNLRRIEALQEFFETLPFVADTTSLADYVKHMNRALHEDRPESHRIPDDAELVAQYFLLYSAGGDPGDFEHVVDYGHRSTNVRVTMERGRWSDFSRVVAAAEPWIEEHFDAPGIRATLAGPATVSHYRAAELRRSHPRGVALAFATVGLLGVLSFRSLAAGVLALLPVALAVLFVYGVMGGAGIWLGIGTSMTVAIAVGLAIDFSTHTIDRLIHLVRRRGLPIEEALAELYASTGRALVYNLLAILLGFGVLATSTVPSLESFGLLVGVCVSASFAGSATLLPALVGALRPRFLAGAASRAR